jgi:hypothetical protein
MLAIPLTTSRYGVITLSVVAKMVVTCGDGLAASMRDNTNQMLGVTCDDMDRRFDSARSAQERGPRYLDLGANLRGVRLRRMIGK